VNGEMNTITPGAVLQPTTRRKKVSFGVSVPAEEAVAIDERIAQLEARLHVPLTRSNYFALLARHDIAHKTVELVMSTAPAVASAA